MARFVVMLSYHGIDNRNVRPRNPRLGRALWVRKPSAQVIMPKPLDPPIADQAPTAGDLTEYDQQHLVTYLRLLDADAEGADWPQVARMVLHIDPSQEPERARRAWESHLARAKWMTEHGYRALIQGSAPH